MTRTAQSSTNISLFGVWGYWDGSAWRGFPSGTRQALNKVWGSGPNDVWAVGSSILTVASWVGRKGDECQNVDDWAGLARRRPAIALVMTLFMLSLAGFPPTGGFFAKFYLFRAAVERPELVWLVVAAVLNSLVSVCYHLRVVTAMYFREGQDGVEYSSWANAVVLVVLAVLVLALGIVPAPFMTLVQ